MEHDYQKAMRDRKNTIRIKNEDQTSGFPDPALLLTSWTSVGKLYTWLASQHETNPGYLGSRRQKATRSIKKT